MRRKVGGAICQTTRRVLTSRSPFPEGSVGNIAEYRRETRNLGQYPPEHYRAGHNFRNRQVPFSHPPGHINLTRTPRQAYLHAVKNKDRASVVNSRLENLKSRYDTWRTRYDSYMLPLIEQATSGVTLASQAAPIVQTASDLDDLESQSNPVTTSDPASLVSSEGAGKKRKLSSDSADQRINDVDDIEREEVDAIELVLPSSYGTAMQKHPSLSSPASMEKKLRQRQADRALDDLQAQIITKYTFDTESERVQNTQQVATRKITQARLKQKNIDNAADEYRRACCALIRLGMPETDSQYRPLKKEDMKPFVIGDAMRQLGDSRKRGPSWIWEDLSFVKSAGSGKISEYYKDGK